MMDAYSKECAGQEYHCDQCDGSHVSRIFACSQSYVDVGLSLCLDP